VKTYMGERVVGRVDLEDLERKFVYRGEFDPAFIRRQLGLDGHNGAKLSEVEERRLATMLLRHDYLSPADLVLLNGRVEPLPEFSRGVCPVHGEGYFENYGLSCAHVDHKGWITYEDRVPGLYLEDS